MAESQTQATPSPIADALATSLRRLFDENRTARSLYEREWLADLRQFLGQYEPEVAKRMDPNRSKAFIRITRTKVKANDARLKDMMFPAGGDKNWAIAPTPSPTEVENAVKMVAAKITPQLQAMAQSGGQPVAGAQGAPGQGMAAQPGQQPGQPQQGAGAPAQTPWVQRILAKLQGMLTFDKIEREVAEVALQDARDRCLRMEKAIDSQLQEARYAAMCGDVIHSGNLHGTGILKGPLVETRSVGHWSTGSGVAEWASRDEARPYLEHVSIWDCYPDMLARNRAEAEFFFQRHVLLKSDLRKLAKRGGFNAKAINDYIAQVPDGDSTPLWFESEIRAINQKTTNTSQRRRYEVLEYWGYVDGADLIEYGVPLPEGIDVNTEFSANVWVLGNRVIKAVLNPFDAGFIPYHFFYFDRDESGIFGVGIAKILRDVQSVFNAAMRAAIDNSAMSAGPMFEILTDLLVEGEDSETIAPFRTFLRKAGAGQPQPAVRVVQVPNNADALLNLAQIIKQLGDEATTIPSYTHGEQDKGVSRTVGGLSMLMGAANITLKDTVRNFDEGITVPTITGMYHWNMQFNSDPSIKGDYEITATGTTSLVAKEMRAQQLEALAQGTMNPDDGIFVNRRELLKQRLLVLDIDPDLLLYSDEQVEQNIAKNSANTPPNPALLKYDIDKMKVMLEQQIAEQKQALAERIQAFKEHEAQLIFAANQLKTIVEQARINV